jgi:hypothetical protein
VAYIHDVGQVCNGTASLKIWVFIQKEKIKLRVAKQSFQNTLNINSEVSNNEIISVFFPFICLFFIYVFIYSLFNDYINSLVYMTASIYKFIYN